jgi:hypothetical protein
MYQERNTKYVSLLLDRIGWLYGLPSTKNAQVVAMHNGGLLLSHQELESIPRVIPQILAQEQNKTRDLETVIDALASIPASSANFFILKHYYDNAGVRRYNDFEENVIYTVLMDAFGLTADEAYRPMTVAKEKNGRHYFAPAVYLKAMIESDKSVKIDKLPELAAGLARKMSDKKSAVDDIYAGLNWLEANGSALYGALNSVLSHRIGNQERALIIEGLRWNHAFPEAALVILEQANLEEIKKLRYSPLLGKSHVSF